jgi:hypothetical protein
MCPTGKGFLENSKNFTTFDAHSEAARSKEEDI